MTKKKTSPPIETPPAVLPKAAVGFRLDYGHYPSDAVDPVPPAALSSLEAAETRIAELEAELARLRAVVKSATTILGDHAELNLSNYSGEEVEQLNSAACEAYSVLRAAAIKAK